MAFSTISVALKKLALAFKMNLQTNYFICFLSYQSSLLNIQRGVNSEFFLSKIGSASAISSFQHRVGLSESRISPHPSTVGSGVPYFPNNEKGWEVQRQVQHATSSQANSTVSAVLERNIMKPQLSFKFVSRSERGYIQLVSTG